MNEVLFLIQVVLIALFAFAADRLGKAALFAWVCIQALLANLFVLKQIDLLGFEVTAADPYVIGSILGLNLLQEKWGLEEAKRATAACFFFLFFFTIISQIHLLFEPSLHDQAHGAFSRLLTPAPRLLAASMLVFFLVQQFDVFFFSFLKRLLPDFSFAVRTSLAIALSQLLDTVLFSFTGLYGIVASIADVIVLSYLVKLFVIGTSLPIIRFLRI